MRYLTITSTFPSPINSLAIGGIFLPNSLSAIPFSNAKKLLGQEFPYAIYDMRAEGGICFNLEALAIVAGTIQENGTLYLVCPEWDQLEQQLDFDALRWNANHAIATPHFYRYFKALVEDFGFTRIAQIELNHTPLGHHNNASNITFTQEQQKIFDNLPLDTASIHLITAPRGRGKSTLSGRLAEKLSQHHNVIITARSHSALPNFWKGIESDKVKFFAPDRLIQMIEQQNISADKWLFVDEAASLPLPMLHKFCGYFEKVVLTTTTQNYEGTGRGFHLKLLPSLSRPVKQWELTQPLRWSENDPLEAFINQLLLLDYDVGADRYVRPIKNRNENERTHQSAPTDLNEYIAFYHLLAQAHYKTTPTDLRRLFDAPDQHYFQIKEENKLIAGCWAVNEGGLDDELTQAIWRGERRPQGNLVAQYLCFQGNLPDACRLKSIRISRIAVQPDYQQKGYGKQLVSQVISQISPLVDFISVSFGLTPELLHFWQSSGFTLVQITPTPEASSGYHSAMMIYPLSEQGKQFKRVAENQFKRDFPLLPFTAPFRLWLNLPMMESNLTFEPSDQKNLQGFIDHHRTFSACYASLKRLYIHQPSIDILKAVFEEQTVFEKSKQKQFFTDVKNKLRTISSIGKI